MGKLNNRSFRTLEVCALLVVSMLNKVSGNHLNWEGIMIISLLKCSYGTASISSKEKVFNKLPCTNHEMASCMNTFLTSLSEIRVAVLEN